jgi:putative oxidoreductase
MWRKILNALSWLSSDRWFDSAVLFMRIFIGAMMLTHGIGKLQNYNAIDNSFPDPLGISSAASFTFITLAEVGCSVLIIMGLFTRLATLPLIFGMFVATFLAFPDKSFAEGELSFVYMGIYIMLLISGGGKYALDALFFPSSRIKREL